MKKIYVTIGQDNIHGLSIRSATFDHEKAIEHANEIKDNYSDIFIISFDTQDTITYELNTEMETIKPIK